MSFPSTKVIAVLLAGVTLAATAGEAFADRNQYTRRHLGGYGYRHHRGIGPGGLAAGAALGIAGAAIAGAAASNYYNGYPAYSYDGGYRNNYGYDYLPGRGYYGPY